MPGLSLAVGRFARRPDLRSDLSFELDPFRRITIALASRLGANSARCNRGDGLDVLFDGYLTDIDGAAEALDFRNQPAAAIAALFAREGLGVLRRLRGSYTALIWLPAQRKAILFNDRRGSRPLFYRTSGEHSLLAAPTVSALLDRPGDATELDVQGLADLLITRGFCDRHTLFRGIQRFPPASYLEIEPAQFRFACYWQPAAGAAHGGINDSMLVDELHHLILKAVQRTLRTARKPVLLLSGGLDSRLVLGSLIDLGMREIPVASYARANADEPDGDAAITVQLAAEFELNAHHYTFDDSEFIADARQATLMYDCRAEVIDAAPLLRVFQILGRKHETFINGDEFPGWRGHVGSMEAALRSVHFHPLRHIPWLANDWLPAPVRRELVRKRRMLKREWWQDFGQPEPDVFKDRLYFRDRAGNYANALAAGKLRYLEQARPLLDEDVVDFLFRLPAPLRFDKVLLRALMARHYAALNRIPYARRTSLPTADSYRRALGTGPEFAALLHRYLLDDMDPRLARLIDRGAIRKFIDSVTRAGSIRAVPYNWLGGLPGGWRLQRHPLSAELNPIAALLRLLQVNLYLKHAC